MLVLAASSCDTCPRSSPLQPPTRTPCTSRQKNPRRYDLDLAEGSPRAKFCGGMVGRRGSGANTSLKVRDGYFVRSDCAFVAGFRATVPNTLHPAAGQRGGRKSPTWLCQPTKLCFLDLSGNETATVLTPRMRNVLRRALPARSRDSRKLDPLKSPKSPGSLQKGSQKLENFVCFRLKGAACGRSERSLFEK